MTNKAVTAQRDFSAGEIDVTMKRDDDDPVFKTGLRQCANFRILDTKKLSNRIGRTALFIDGPRVDEVLMSPGNIFKLCFSAGTLNVRNSAGAIVFTQNGFPWAANNVGSITWAIYQLSIYITFPGMQPQVLSWDGVSVWSVAAYAETVTAGGQKRTFFTRISPPSVTMLPSAQTGSITLAFSSPIAVAGMVGTRMRFVGRQVLITGFIDTSHLNATVEEPLLPGESIGFAVDPRNTFNVGDVVIGQTSGSRGIVVALSSGSMNVQLITANPAPNTIGSAPDMTVSFLLNEIVAGPAGGIANNAVGALGAPFAVSVWDEEVMNSFRGWPSSVTVDQGRLVFMNFPAVPGGIGYSAIGVFTDLYIPFAGVVASNAIFEIAPNKSQILFMVAGMEGSEFIFCDNAVYYFPITISQPLSATVGVAFNLLTRDGCALSVQPQLIQEAVVYVSAGGSTVRAITATGAFQRPYEVRPISMLHDHLFKSPVAITAPSSTDPNFPERYIYVLNSDGTLAIGKLQVRDGQIQGAVGWVSMSGVGAVQWVSARASDVIFTTTYAPNNITPVTIAEINDATQFVDAGLPYNNVPTALAAPAGKGPLWWLAGGAATVMDKSTRQLGLYQIDANGFLVPQFEGGENLTSAQLVAGQSWTAIAEPFVPSAQPGQDIGQRTSKRRISRFAVNYQNSSGFLMARLFSGPLRPAGPVLGTIMNFFRVTTYNQDDDPTQSPPLREGVDRWRPSGRSYDPRAAVIKDTAGPLNILEIDLEASV